MNECLVLKKTFCSVPQLFAEGFTGPLSKCVTFTDRVMSLNARTATKNSRALSSLPVDTVCSCATHSLLVAVRLNLSRMFKVEAP